MEQQTGSNGITFIDTGYLRHNFAASHMIVEKGKVAFVDVGTAYSVDRLLHALHGEGLTENDVLYVILTHIHLDHAGGAGQLMRIFPNARLVVHPKGARHMAKPDRLVAGAKEVYGEENFNRLYGEVIGIDPDRIIEALDGSVLDLAGRELHFLDSPGHARHHCCVWDPRSRGVFTGDAFGLAYPELQRVVDQPFLVCTTSPAAFEPDAMVASIERIESLNPRTLYLTHFGPVRAEQEAIERLKKMVLEHKELGRQYGGEQDQLRQGVRQIFITAYKDYLGSNQVEKQQLDLLADDIKMNAQGISIWAEREQERRAELILPT